MQHLRFSYKGYTGIRSRVGVWIVCDSKMNDVGACGSIAAALNLIKYHLEYNWRLKTWAK